MNLTRKVGLFLATALVGSGLPLLSASTIPAAVASGNGSIQTTGPCGDLLNERQQNVGQITLNITIPDPDPNDQWTFTAQQQEYDATTGGAIGNPIDLVANHTLTPLVFNSAEGGFNSTGAVTDTSGRTHGFSYTATRVSDGLTCSNQAFWTTPSNAPGPVVPPNPTGKPETPAAPTRATEADSNTNDVLIQFDQGLLDTAAGIPANSQFTIQVNGAVRTVTGVQITNDNPPAQSIVTVLFDGAPLVSGQTVQVSYRKPLSSTAPHLQDFNGNPVASFGPLSVPVF